MNILAIFGMLEECIHDRVEKVVMVGVDHARHNGMHRPRISMLLIARLGRTEVVCAAGDAWRYAASQCDVNSQVILSTEKSDGGEEDANGE